MRFTFIVHIQLFLLIHVKGQVPTCCQDVVGPSLCKYWCGQISMQADDEKRKALMVNVIPLCPKRLENFWQCINDTLQAVDNASGWWGRPCCDVVISTSCQRACVQAMSKSDLHGHCRQSHEPNFYKCLRRQEDGNRCCSHANSGECEEACRVIFDSSKPATHTQHKVVRDHCTGRHNGRVVRCVENHSKVKSTSNPMESIHCCEESNNIKCKETCRIVLRNFTTEQEIMDGLVAACDLPFKLPQDPLWQCFLWNSASSGTKEDGRRNKHHERVSTIDTTGLDAAKLQCCKKAVTAKCRNLCTKTFSTDFTQSWQKFELHCRYQPSELPLISCLADVEEPCEPGCSGLSYCTNFNDRPTELFRSCNQRADAAARNDIMLWKNGTINHRMLLMNIPVLDISKCEPQLWKAIACMLQIKPCNTRAYTNPICKSDCLMILSKCADRSRLLGNTPESICNAMAPIDDSTPCISVTKYLIGSPYAASSHDVSHPCKPNPCGKNQICTVQRHCTNKRTCVPYICQPGCKMGEVSEFLVPHGTFVRIPTPNNDMDFRDWGCYKVCQCTEKNILEKCENMPCQGARTCLHGDKVKAHNTHWYDGCNVCVCYDGEVTCSNRMCPPSQDNAVGYRGLPCYCREHYKPVCGINGRTYPNECLASCALMSEDQYSLGACAKDPCHKNSCGANERCIPRRRICLVNFSKNSPHCKQYDCVPLHINCEAETHNSICKLENPNSLCQFIRADGHHKGTCVQNCKSEGTVCGRNGETYSSECAAWADKVAVDYSGPCKAVGQLTYLDVLNSQCTGVMCPPLNAKNCKGITPPGNCCPVCAAEVRIIYSRSQANRAAKATKSDPLTVHTITSKLQAHVMVPECDVFGYLSIESELIILVIPVVDSPTHVQIKACHTEAMKIELMIRSGSPILLSDLSLSPLIAAGVRTSHLSTTGSAASRVHLSVFASVFCSIAFFRYAVLPL